MEAIMTFFEGLCEDFCKPEVRLSSRPRAQFCQGLPFLEQLITLNIQWMLEAGVVLSPFK